MGEKRSGSPSMLDLKGPAEANLRGLKESRKKCEKYKKQTSSSTSPVGVSYEPFTVLRSAAKHSRCEAARMLGAAV